MATQSYVDIGAVQRREPADGSPAANTSYRDIGAVQRQEAAAAAGGPFPHYIRRWHTGGMIGMGSLFLAFFVAW